MTRSLEMPNARLRHVPEVVTVSSKTKREIKIFGVGKERRVENGGGAHRVQPNEERAPRGVRKVTAILPALGRVSFEPHVNRPSAPQREPGAAEPEDVLWLPERDLRRDQRCPRAPLGFFDKKSETV